MEYVYVNLVLPDFLSLSTVMVLQYKGFIQIHTSSQWYLTNDLGESVISCWR